MQLCETINGTTGARRYYVDGRRISGPAFGAIKGRASRLDCLHTVTRGAMVRHYSCARLVQP
jgi:hypothetical protein